MTGYINTVTGEIVEDYKAVEDIINKLNGTDFQDYVVTNYGEFIGMCVKSIGDNEIKITHSTHSDINLLTALYDEMIMAKRHEWIYFDSDTDCLKCESDD